MLGLARSAVGVVHEAAERRDAVSHAIARDGPGDVFPKVDVDQARIDVEAVILAPVPTPVGDSKLDTSAYSRPVVTAASRTGSTETTPTIHTPGTKAGGTVGVPAPLSHSPL